MHPPGDEATGDEVKYGSVCSGIEAATTAWHSLGWEPQWFAEIEKFPSEILAHHYPEVKNLGDFTKITAADGAIDVLVGGTPCQSFSVAGKRAGLDDPRGNLTLEFVRLLKRTKPKWFVWENVPGVLSIDKGRTFAEFLQAVEECGYGWAYRVLDAQYVRTHEYPRAVPQRRRRVFVVGYLGGAERAGAVLFESEGVCGNPPPSRSKGKVAPTIPASGVGPSRTGNERTEEEDVAFKPSHYTRGKDGKPNDVTPPLAADTKQGDQEPVVFEARFARNGRGAPSDVVPPLKAQSGDTGKGDAAPLVAFSSKDSGQDASAMAEVSPPINAGGNETGGHRFPGTTVDTAESLVVTDEVSQTLNQRDGKGPGSYMNGSLQGCQMVSGLVRRLTPTECERLQGFPDNYTRIAWRGKAPEDCPDGPRYRAIGNSMAVNVMQWIGRRIQMVEEITDDN